MLGSFIGMHQSALIGIPWSFLGAWQVISSGPQLAGQKPLALPQIIAGSQPEASLGPGQCTSPSGHTGGQWSGQPVAASFMGMHQSGAVCLPWSSNGAEQVMYSGGQLAGQKLSFGEQVKGISQPAASFGPEQILSPGGHTGGQLLGHPVLGIY